MHPELTTVPLQSRPNASPFWIMLLLSSPVFERTMIEAGQRRQSGLQECIGDQRRPQCRADRPVRHARVGPCEHPNKFRFWSRWLSHPDKVMI